jgi:hypothetical protein
MTVKIKTLQEAKLMLVDKEVTQVVKVVTKISKEDKISIKPRVEKESKKKKTRNSDYLLNYINNI